MNGEFLQEAKDAYILCALRFYGDTLSETLEDPALSEKERKDFEIDSKNVELLIKEFEEKFA